MKIDHWLPLVAMERLWRITKIKPEDICWYRWEPWWWEYFNTFSVSTSALCWQHPLIWAMGTLEQPLHLFFASRETQAVHSHCRERQLHAICTPAHWGCWWEPITCSVSSPGMKLLDVHTASSLSLCTSSPITLFAVFGLPHSSLSLRSPSSKSVLSPSLVLLLSGTKALLWNG